MVRQKRYPLWHLIHALRLLGVDLSQVLATASLPSSLEGDNAASGVADEQERLFAAALAMADGPDFPLRFALTFSRVPCGVTFYGFRMGRTFGEALQMLIRYKGDTSPERLVGSLTNEEFELRVIHRHEAPSGLASVMFFAWLTEVQRTTYRVEAEPLRVTLAEAVPNLELFEQHLKCSVQLGQQNTIVFHREALGVVPLLAYPSPSSLSPGVSALPSGLESTEDACFSALVSAVLRENLEQGRLGAKEVANYLGTSVRTLQRRLASEGVTLRTLHDCVRRNLASELLLDSSVKTAEIARRLGYGDAGAFFKAFRGWHGVTPGQFREAGRPRAS